MFAADIGVGGESCTEVGSIVHERPIPFSRTFPIQCCLDEGHDGCIGNRPGAGEKIMQVCAPNVRFNKNTGKIPGKCSNCSCGGSSNAGKRAESLSVLRQFSAPLGGNNGGGALQRKGAPIVSEPLPRGKDRRLGRARKRGKGRELLQKWLVFVEHARYLSLLEHYFRDEDCIRAVSFPPREETLMRLVMRPYRSDELFLIFFNNFLFYSHI